MEESGCLYANDYIGPLMPIRRDIEPSSSPEQGWTLGLIARECLISKEDFLKYYGHLTNNKIPRGLYVEENK